VVEGLIVKLSNSFQKEWSFTERRNSTYTSFYDVEQTVAGDFIAAGKYSYKFAWIVKLTAWGDVIWNKNTLPPAIQWVSAHLLMLMFYKMEVL
jgi:hypothetical protein